MIVIYDRIVIGLYCKTTILVNLTFARSVNYDREVRCKLKHNFTIVTYDPKTFIVQAGNTERGSNTVPLTSIDWFGLVCFANKNKNCQFSYS